MTAAFLLIDVQNEWTSGNEAVTESIKRAVEEMRDEMPVIWAYTEWLEDLGKPKRAGKLWLSHEFNGRATDIYEPTLEMEERDWVVAKDNLSVFSNPYFAYFLHRKGITKLYIAGFMATQCVLASAEHGVENGFEVILLSDLTADYNDQLPDESELDEYRDFGAQVRTFENLGLFPG